MSSSTLAHPGIKRQWHTILQNYVPILLLRNAGSPKKNSSSFHSHGARLDVLGEHLDIPTTVNATYTFGKYPIQPLSLENQRSSELAANFQGRDMIEKVYLLTGY